LRVIVLAELALPLAVDAVAAWPAAAPGRVAVAIAEAALMGRALPLAPAGLARARPDIFVSRGAAEAALRAEETRQRPYKESTRSLYKGVDVFPLVPESVIPVHYRRAGAHGRLMPALVPPEGGRDRLEAIVGELAAYAVAEPAGRLAVIAAEPQAPALSMPVPVPAASAPIESRPAEPAEMPPTAEAEPLADLVARLAAEAARPVITESDRIMALITAKLVRGAAAGDAAALAALRRKAAANRARVREGPPMPDEPPAEPAEMPIAAEPVKRPAKPLADLVAQLAAEAARPVITESDRIMALITAKLVRGAAAGDADALAALRRAAEGNRPPPRPAG
jgi:hypothetical protein